MLGLLVAVRGKPEQDMVSLRMMGWGLVLLENSSAAVAAAAVAVTQGGSLMVVVGYDYYTRLRLLYKATTTLQGYDYSTVAAAAVAAAPVDVGVDPQKSRFFY